tara:strand:+ start:565 stop:996 length:432 start_codon:yes stop_codon:yes gene_type:complete
MNVLAIKSSGDHTSISIMMNEEINSYSMKHARKERPDWNLFLKNIGHNSSFKLKEIDLFAFANSQNSYTATRTVASYMKGLAVGLNKPLISVEDSNDDDFEADSVAKIAKNIFLASNSDSNQFDPIFANPSYEEEVNFKKLDE